LELLLKYHGEMIEFSISQFSVPAFPEQKPFWEVQLQTMFFFII